MGIWLWISIALLGSLFVLKMIYVLSTVLAIGTTRGALYVSTARCRVSAFLDAVPMNGDQLLVDLGCGDGRVLRMARQRYGVRAIGFEVNVMAYIKARLLSLGRKGIEIRRQNFLKADLSEADIVFCYLFPDVMRQLAEKVASELKPGAVVVSCNFPLPGFTAERILRPDGALIHDPIYIYRM